MAKSIKGRTLGQDELADLVGDMAAFMVFGQGGASIGKTFNLRRIDKSGRRLKFKVTSDGAKVLGEDERLTASDLIEEVIYQHAS